MGQPNVLKRRYPANAGGERGELKHLSTRRRRKINNDSPSSGERPGNSPNRRCPGIAGVVGPRCRKSDGEWKELESSAIEGDSPLHEAMRSVAES